MGWGGVPEIMMSQVSNHNNPQLDALQTLIKEIEGLAADVTGRLTDDRIAQLQKEYSWLDKLDYGDDYEEGTSHGI